MLEKLIIAFFLVKYCFLKFFFKEFFSINFFFIANLFYFINFHYFHFSKKTLLQNLYFFSGFPSIGTLYNLSRAFAIHHYTDCEKWNFHFCFSFILFHVFFFVSLFRIHLASVLLLTMMMMLLVGFDIVWLQFVYNFI